MMPTFQNSAPSWSPDFIYSQQERIQPYNNEQFLNQIFNFNNQSITAFQSLPHQLKLKFFLSVEEMKLLGYMNDKQGYQYILQQIARRRALITKVPAKQVEQKKVQQTIEWGEKLEHLCQDHLKKIQKDNFLDDIPIEYTISHHQTKQLDFLTGETIGNSNKKTIHDNEQDEFEWAQTGQKTSNTVSYGQNQVQTFSTSPVTVTHNVKQTNNNDEEQFGQFCQENVSNGGGNQGGNANSNGYGYDDGGFQGGYSSYAVEQPKRQEVAKLQHIDVWDLEVLQQQSPKKVIENVLSSKNIQAPPSPKKIPSYTSISSSKNVEQAKANHEQIYSQNSIKAHQQVQTYQNGFHNENNANEAYNYGSYNPVVSGIARSYGDLNYLDGFSFQPQPTNTHIQQDNSHHNQFKVQPSLKSQTSHKSEHSQSSHHQTPTINNTPSSPNIQNSMSFQFKNTVTPVSYDIDFDFLGPSKTSQNIHQNVQASNSYGSPFESSHNSNARYSFDVSVPNVYQQNTAENPMSKSQPLDTSFGLDLSVLDNELVLNAFNTSQTNQPNTQFFKKKFAKAPQEQYFQSQQQIDQNQDAPSNLLSTIDTSLLQPLLVRPQTKTLQSFLSKKLFDFDRKFYKEALNLLQVLGYKDNPDYSYIKDQRDICAEIYRLTEMFSAAVDQDREEEVKESLKKTKLLYKSLDAKKTTMLVKKYMKLQGKSLEYQIGKLSLQAGVPKDLLAKAISSRKNSKVSFSEVATLLYLMSYFGSTYNITVFTCHVTEYVDKIVQEMQTLAAQLSTFDPSLVQIIKNNQKFIDYKQNIRKILILTQRIITLSSYCNKDQLLPQTLSLAQKLPQPSSSSLLPSHIPTFFTNLAQNNCINIYTLHSQMNQFMNLHPLCCLCLQSVEELGGGQNGGAKRDDHRFYHFFCFNFRSKVAKWKEVTMKVSFAEISSQGNEIKIQPQIKLDQNIRNSVAENIQALHGLEKKEEQTKNEQINIEIKTQNTEQKIDPLAWPEQIQSKNSQSPQTLTTKTEQLHYQPFSAIQPNDNKNGNQMISGLYGGTMMMADEGHAWQFQQNNHIQSTHNADVPISVGQSNGVEDDEDQWQQAEVIGDV